MSQIVNAIMATDTGERKLIKEGKFSPLFQDVFERKEHLSEGFDSNGFIAKMYKIGVTLGNQVTVSEINALHLGDYVLEEAIVRTKLAVIEAIFGEFREDFYRIEGALYDRDFQKARTLLTSFQRKMYEVNYE